MTAVYLDYHATTPLDPRVLEAMLPYFTERFGNPASKTHPWGWTALEAVEGARRLVASTIGATTREVVFTGGATEANNIAILGSAAGAAADRDHIVTQAVEHHAVLDPIRALQGRGFRVTILPVDSRGRVDPERVRDALTDRTLLVSIMAAQNEVGTIQPVAEIARICRERGALLHSDAAQAVGKIPVDVEALDVDLLSLSGHKLYGPKGVGALYVRRRRRRAPLKPVDFGGGQEDGIRPGTLNVPGIVGLGEACRICALEMEEEAERVASLRDRLRDGVRAALPDARVNGPDAAGERLPGNLSLSFPRVDGTALLVALQDIGASAGSACTAGNHAPSYVLKAIGVPGDLAAATLRLGLGRFTTERDVDFAARRIVETVTGMRARGR